jgi:hypothetical protein
MAYKGGGMLTVGSKAMAFDPTAFIGVVMNNIENRLEAAGELLANRARENFTEMSPPPSEPWQYPHIDLREPTQMVDYIDYTVFDRGSDVVLQVGIIDETLPGRLGIYPGLLETGTSTMDPRPWLTISLDETWWEIGSLLTGMESAE